MTLSSKAVAVSKLFYTEREIAEALVVSIKSTQGWRLRGKGPPWKKLAGAVRYPIDAFEKWIREQPGGGGQL